MASYEVEKILSLKLTALSKKDQRWILNRLPQQSRDKISQTMKLARKFKINSLEELSKLAPMQANDGASIDNSQNQAASISHFTGSDALLSHCQQIVAGQVEVTPAVKQLIDKWLESDLECH